MILMLQDIGTQLNMNFSRMTNPHYATIEDNNSALDITTYININPRNKHFIINYRVFGSNIGLEKGIVIHRVEK